MTIFSLSLYPRIFYIHYESYSIKNKISYLSLYFQVCFQLCRESRLVSDSFNCSIIISTLSHRETNIFFLTHQSITIFLSLFFLSIFFNHIISSFSTLYFTHTVKFLLYFHHEFTRFFDCFLIKFFFNCYIAPFYPWCRGGCYVNHVCFINYALIAD